MSPRRYELGRRQAASAATRAKILEATRALIAGPGDPAEFSMDAVAAKAGVSRMTVYNQFRSQPKLLEALADSLAERGGMSRLANAFLAPNLEEAVATFVGTFVTFWASDRLLLRRLRAMGVLMPSVYRKLRDRDEWRREAARNIVAKFDVRAGSVSGDARWAADLLSAMSSFEMFDLLCEDGRRPEELAASLSEAVLHAWGSGGTVPGNKIRRRRAAA
jgi:AcrR family transcriptional regulator